MSTAWTVKGKGKIRAIEKHNDTKNKKITTALLFF